MQRILKFAAMVCFVGLGIGLGGEARADYFFDQGFSHPVIRTDYNASNKGTSANPLTLTTCIYPANSSIDPLVIDGTCNYSPASFPQSNYFAMNGGGTATRFWLLLMNNEPWNGSLSGPPDQSLPRSLPGQGVMGFNPLTGSLPGETFYRAHLVLNNFGSLSAHQASPNSIPFLSLSVDSRRGNGSTIGAMNSPTRPHVVSFVSRLWDTAAGPNGDGLYNHYFWTTANWGGRNRMLFINLYGNIRWSYLPYNPQRPWEYNQPGLHRHWSWPIQESAMYPGGDIAFFDVYALAQVCPQAIWGDANLLQFAGDERFYSFDLTAAFRCASDLGYFDSPMPGTVVSLLQAGWANEATHEGAGIWTSVHGMQMEVPGGGQFAAPPAPMSPLSLAPAPGESVEDIRRALATSCDRDPACAKSATQWPVSRGVQTVRSGSR